MSGSRPTIVAQDGPHGRRLAYYLATADADYWDELWRDQFARHDYARAERGHLPPKLERTFARWVKPPARVLEAGCGLAAFTVACHARGYRAEGVDWGEEVVARLRERYPHLDFRVGDVRRLDVPDGTYDAVYSPGVCEHFEAGPDETLRETRRILRPGGIAVVSTPCFNPVRQALDRLGAFHGAPRGEFYQYAFSPAEMAGRLEDLGFEVLQIQTSGTLKTLTDHVPGLGQLPRSRLIDAVALALDRAPVTRRWGHSCIWVARRTA